SSDYRMLARTMGLTRSQATVRHARKNARVPILPSIISMFVGVIGGSIIIEQIFGVPGIGALFLKSINLKDYDVFMASSMFYTVIGLAANILIDLSYGFLDPRIRMGER
ncbi:MAG: ABC transporter permease, partial [Clostridia bacterium]|nr:ABC transporter permease [Clostridia bacterium]